MQRSRFIASYACDAGVSRGKSSTWRTRELRGISRFAELTNTAYSLESESFKAAEVYVTLGVAYLIVVWTLSALTRVVERRLALPEAR